VEDYFFIDFITSVIPITKKASAIIQLPHVAVSTLIKGNSHIRPANKNSHALSFSIVFHLLSGIKKIIQKFKFASDRHLNMFSFYSFILYMKRLSSTLNVLLNVLFVDVRRVKSVAHCMDSAFGAPRLTSY